MSSICEQPTAVVARLMSLELWDIPQIYCCMDSSRALQQELARLQHNCSKASNSLLHALQRHPVDRFIRLAGMTAMKETLAQLPIDHSNARSLAEGTVHFLLYRAAQLHACVFAHNCTDGHSGKTWPKRRACCLH